MIAARLPRSASFADRIAYLFRNRHALFDAAQGLVSIPQNAAPHMQATAAAQARLKKAAGVRRGGRRCANPVSHDVISWDEDERPEFSEMERAARSFLAAIGLGEHQAVMVGHEHNGKRHVHIVANAVHPVTGRVADRTDDHKRAQAWCLAYEQAQGRIRCRHRTAPRMAKAFAEATGRRYSAQRPERAEWNRRRKRKQSDQHAKARHKAAKWARLIENMQANAANERQRQEKQKASLAPAPHH